MASPSKHALTVIAQAQISTTMEISKLQSVALQQLEMIRRMERDSALRAILVGLMLHRVKVSLKHGEFGPWIAENVEGVGKSQVNYYMRLATAFLEKTRLVKAELLAMPDNTTSLADDDLARAFMSKAEKFVGDCSLNELLIKYSIKGVVREGDDGENPNAPAPGADGQLYFSEVSQYLYGFRTTALRPESLARLTPEQLRAVRAEHDAQNAELHQLCEKAGIK